MKKINVYLYRFINETLITMESKIIYFDINNKYIEEL